MTSSSIVYENLLSLPRERDVKNNFHWLFCSTSFLAYSLIFYYIFLDAHSYESRHLFSWLLVLFFVFNLIYVIKVTHNLLLLFRYGIIWGTGFFVNVGYLIFDDAIYFANFGAEFQTNDITCLFLLASSLASFGVALAVRVSRERLEFRQSIPHICSAGVINPRMFFYVGLMVAVLFTTFLIWREGGFIILTSSTYRVNMVEGVKFGAGGSMVLIGIAMMLVSAISGSDGSVKRVLLVSVFLLFLQILAGKRADSLFPLIVMTVLLVNIYRLQYRIKYTMVMVIVLLSVVLGAFVGTSRVDKNMDLVFIKAQQAGPVLELHTANQMIGTFYAVVHNLKSGDFEYLFGKSYFDWVLRIPPAFLGLKRPDELAHEMKIGSQIMAQGGVYEISEAYWNFGIFGAFFIPFIVTLLLTRLLYLASANKRLTVISMVVFLSLGFMSTRGIWYQNFAYFRTLTSALLIFFILFPFYNNFWRVRPA